MCNLYVLESCSFCFKVKLATTARFARLRCSLRLQGDIVDFMCIMVPAPKKIGLGRPLKALRPLEGPGEARDHQGPPGINAVVKRNRLSQKKNFGLGRPLMASRPLEGSGGAGHHQGPSGIDAGVKRNHLSQKKNSASAGLRRPLEATRGRNLGLPRYFWASLDLSFP